MHKIIPFFVLAFWITGTAFPNKAVTENPAREGEPTERLVSFRKDVWPFFQTKCNTADCHGKNGAAFPKYNTYVMIKAKAKKIVKRLEDTKDPMPPLDSGIKVTQAEMEMLKSWIDAGRPNN